MSRKGNKPIFLPNKRDESDDTSSEEDLRPKRKIKKMKNNKEDSEYELSPSDLQALLSMMDKEPSQTQQEIIDDQKTFLNNLDWQSGLKKNEIKKYKKMWDDICDSIVYVPLISDILKLKIGIAEKADFIHKLLILYSLPLDSFEYIQMRKSLLVLYNKYNSIQLTQQQLTKYSELEKNMSDITEYQTSLKYTILGSNMIEKNKSFVYSRYQQLLNESENGKLKIWINTALSIPTESHKSKILGTKKITPKIVDKYLCDIKNVLDNELYGMNNIKEQLIFLINNKIMKNDVNGAAIALEGLPGIGKTCIVQALAKSLDLPMVCIPIGGAKDSSFLTGFSYTYEGAQPGAIVQALQELKCTNGIIFIDEIDKIPHTDKGNEISKALLHIIDPSQNHAFHDKYLTNQFDIDLSKIWFIYTLNDRNDIEKTLRDRIPIIRVKGYTFNEKYEIATKYLIPRSLKNMNINVTDIQFSPDAIRYLINLLKDKQLDISDSDGRSGVRQLRYIIDYIIMKLNLLRSLWDPSCKYIPKLELTYGISGFKLPLVVTPEIINQLDINTYYQNDGPRHLSMYS
jgi:ATP-dependent Lon protease